MNNLCMPCHVTRVASGIIYDKIPKSLEVFGARPYCVICDETLDEYNEIPSCDDCEEPITEDTGRCTSKFCTSCPVCNQPQKHWTDYCPCQEDSELVMGQHVAELEAQLIANIKEDYNYYPCDCC